jgi:outer membrane lipoprotein-sorting protein
LITAFCLVFITGVLQAQTAEKIIKQNIKKSGSKKFAKIETIIMTGNLPTPQGDFPITIYNKRPNKSKSQLDIMGSEMIPSAFDGETAWMVNPFAGASSPQKLPDETTLLVAEQAEFEPLYINYKDRGYTITLDGTEDVKGKSCYKLKVEKAGGNPQYHFLDTETYMLIKVNAKGADGSRADTFFSDYKKTDFGIMMPFTWEISSQMGPQQIVFSKITANEPIDDKEFAFPGG